MRKFYSKILLLTLSILMGLITLFTKHAFASNDFAMMGIVAPPSPEPMELIINFIKKTLVPLTLYLSIALLAIYALLRFKKINNKANLFLTTGTISFVFCFLLMIATIILKSIYYGNITTESLSLKNYQDAPFYLFFLLTLSFILYLPLKNFFRRIRKRKNPKQ